ncbi:MAG: hypothetical protein ACFFCS_09360 [Candidatus Hodarchaeota archaeon]
MISTKTQKTCFTCNYMTSEPAANYCPECGVHLEEVGEDYKVPEEPKGCPHCGFMENEEEAKFCMECGNPLSETEQERIMIVPIRTIEEKVQEKVAAAQEKVAKAIASGPQDKLLWLPVASYFEDGERYGGKIWLVKEKLVFDSKKHDLIEIPVDTIAKASIGDRDNLLEIHLQDGSMERFRLVKAEPWVNRITSLVEA